jgi:hypothetical protein
MNKILSWKNIFLLCFFTYLSFGCQAQQTILLNQPYSDLDPRYRYTYELLLLVIQATEDDFGKAQLQSAKYIKRRDKTLLQLVKDGLIDVMAEAPKPSWDQNLLVVPIPIRRGIQGFRVFIIHRNSQQLMNSVTSIDDLKQLETGSGEQWSTFQILQQAGFKIMTAESYEGLFGMLNKGRFVTFGRGINEAYRELQVYHKQYPNLLVDGEILLNK